MQKVRILLEVEVNEVGMRAFRYEHTLDRAHTDLEILIDEAISQWESECLIGTIQVYKVEETHVSCVMMPS